VAGTGSFRKESTFSRKAQFAEMELPQFVPETWIGETQKDRFVGDIARDSITLEARLENFPKISSTS
jgi:hypothetical protein